MSISNPEYDLDVFEKAEREQRAIDAMLDKVPIVTVSGVVDANEVGGGISQGETLWRLNIPLAVWKIEGKPGLRESNLRIRKRITRQELNSISEAYSAYSLFSARIRLAESPNDPSAYGLLLEVLTPPTDPELLRASKELQNPVFFEDPFFGRFKLDRRVKDFDIETTWKNQSVSLHLDSANAPELLIPTARELWKSQELWDQAIREYAAKVLTPVKNDYWVDGFTFKTSEKSFARKLRLQSITVRPNEEFEFYFDDAGLFHGHAIIVCGGIANGLTRADIAG